MAESVRRIFTEKKREFNIEARTLFEDIKTNLKIRELDSIRVAYCYDIMGLSDEEYERASDIIFKPTYTEEIYHENLSVDEGDRILGVQYLEGQYDQRAESTSKAIQTAILGNLPIVRVTKVIIFKGQFDEKTFEKTRDYIINPVESMAVSMEKPKTLIIDTEVPRKVDTIHGFIVANKEELEDLLDEMGLAMDMDDLLFCQEYFKNIEDRDPTITEMRMIDTYWSDHCRHTTFLTGLKDIGFEKGFAEKVVRPIFEDYKDSRRFVYKDREKEITLMDIATIAMKEMKRRGTLDDLDESEEINACSIAVTANIDGEDEEWLVMFKNETHNHPTEIEPFGGAATCLGGAIRDPLSGRSYVYQAMRITGSGDPRTDIHNTLEGKLPQLKITTGAAAGYSSYGNQIGLPAGQVVEIYDPGYVAKRMELGAVVAAAPRENVVRQVPKHGDVVILVGGRTGRDGCGGATGSSKAHTEDSARLSGAEVQKGNPAEERKIQRLFRRKEVSTLIKRCNDFGAGGVSVAIGELAPGLLIDLDSVPQKYKGLDGTEIAISESQERMAVVVDKKNKDSFIAFAKEENLEANVVALVTEEARLKMKWQGNTIVDISREFLDSNGVSKTINVKTASPDMEENFFDRTRQGWIKPYDITKDLKKIWLGMLGDLSISSQRGLVQGFDSTIGGSTVLMPLGGKYQLTPAEGMAAKLPVLKGDTTTGTIMTFGYNPKISKWSPFHGGVYAIVEALAKVTAIGGDYKKVRLSLQEYFERLGDDPEKWGMPFSALLGAYYVQNELEIPAIGGKDSMSGTFNGLVVPPTLVAFGVTAYDVRDTISPEFKKHDSRVVMIPLGRDEWGMPNLKELKNNYTRIYELAKEKKILAAHSVRGGGIAETISKMAFGNKIGFKFHDSTAPENLFSPDYGSIILELKSGQALEEIFNDIPFIDLGKTTKEPIILLKDLRIDLHEAIEKWEGPLEGVFPTKPPFHMESPKILEGQEYNKGIKISPQAKHAKPRVFIPIFPGTASEYDLIRAFENAGALVKTLVFKNMNVEEIKESIDKIAEAIGKSQIIAVPSGLSLGEELERAGLLGTTILSHPKIYNAITEHLNHRDGLMLGLGGGLETLLNLGLIHERGGKDINLTRNLTGAHISRIGKIRVVSNLSPWFMNAKVGENYTTAISHREGILVVAPEVFEDMAKKGQIATQFVLGNGGNGDSYSPMGIEGITSADGRVFGGLGYPERFAANVALNIPHKNIYNLFESGVSYYR